MNSTSEVPSRDQSTGCLSSLTNGQEMAIALVPIFPSMLSIAGSLTIIRLVLGHPKMQKSAEGGSVLGNLMSKGGSYLRILFFMSCYDVVNSCTVVLQTFLVPRATSRRLWAIGTDFTCSVMGFLYQANHPSLMYFALLSYYYLLTIRFGMKEETFSRYVEFPCHLLVVGFPTFTAILGAAWHLYGEVTVGAGCWLAVNDDCDHECLGRISWVFGGLPFILSAFLIIVNNLLVYLHVRSTVKRSVSRSFVSSLSTELSTRRYLSDSNFGVEGPSPASEQRQQRQQQQQQQIQRWQESQNQKVQAVGSQAMLYVFVVFLTYVWTLVLRLMSNKGADSSEEARVYIVLLLRAIFLPAMGFGTAFVYVRPRYVQCRCYYPNRGRLWALMQVLQRDTNWRDEYQRGTAARQQVEEQTSNVAP